MIQGLMLFMWGINIFEGFRYLHWTSALFASVNLFWFIFAPWCLSEYPIFFYDMGRWKQISSIYRLVRFELNQSADGE